MLNAIQMNYNQMIRRIKGVAPVEVARHGGHRIADGHTMGQFWEAQKVAEEYGFHVWPCGFISEEAHPAEKRVRLSAKK